ncbi:hypothetical protein N7513_002643 [Penicillium frequentans]|nr:hypothetical protein N7513_002643 [Penicillium glabrum]
MPPDRPSSPDQDFLGRMPEECQRRISVAYERSVSGASQSSRISALSNVSDFLEARVNQLSSEEDFYRLYHDALLDIEVEKIQKGQKGQQKDVNEKNKSPEMAVTNTLQHLAMVLRELRFIEKFGVTVERDVNDDLAALPDTDNGARIKFVEEAYAKTLVARIQSLSGNQDKCPCTKHELQRFRQDVIERYGGFYTETGEQQVWCHITGRAWAKEVVKAAHIVPKGLGGGEIAFSFGESEFIRKDPRNGLTLHKNVESQMDQGRIAIVPAEFPVTAENSSWKCFVIVDDMMDKIVTSYGDERILWRHLHEKPLTFRTPNRPARRYLYLRFLATYMYAKKHGYTRFTEAVETNKDFWPSPGPYLEKSTLLAVARTAGLVLPESILGNTTFERRPSDASLKALVPGAAMQLSQSFETDQKTPRLNNEYWSSLSSSSEGEFTDGED